MDETRGLDVVLEGDSALLRPWKVEDAAWYVESRDAEVFRWTTEKQDLTIGEAEEAIRSVGSDPDVMGLAIVDRETMDLAGNIALVFREDDRQTAEIMYWLAPSGRGRGLASDSVTALCRWAFDSFGLGQICLKTHRGNARSQAVARRAGFQARNIESGTASDCLWFDLQDSG